MNPNINAAGFMVLTHSLSPAWSCFIRPEAVIAIEPHMSGDECVIFLAGGQSVTVRWCVIDVMALIEEGLKARP